MFRKVAMNGALIGMVASGATHAAAAGGLYFYFWRQQQSPIVAELDLSMLPLAHQVPNQGGGYGRRSEEWFIAKQGKKAPAPQPRKKVETKEEIVKQDAAPSTCQEPCPENGPVVGQGWGGGNGLGDGEYVPADQTSRRPRWLKNFITSRDYPAVARREGKDGRVVLTVLIDADGRVRDARLLQGSYPELNEVALRKIHDAIFTPAYDESGRPVSCKVTLPIRFELR